MIAVIADDITGAAEMAGIAHRLGLRVKLTMQPESASDCDVLVIATDTRSMTEEEAAAGSARVAGALGAMPEVDSLFKKTDSALRGHVVAELEAILANTGYRKALYLPANPSKGRTIRDGVYYIGGKPLHETDFSFDPEFPAFSSRLIERLPMCEEKKNHLCRRRERKRCRKGRRDSCRRHPSCRRSRHVHRLPPPEIPGLQGDFRLSVRV